MGQLGLGDNTFRNILTQVAGSDWEYVECGYNHTLAVKTNGELYSTGYNNSGQLGLGDTANRNEFTLVGTLGEGNYEGRPLFGGGGYHSLALYINTLRSAGRNYEGQLAISSLDIGRSSFGTISQSTPDRDVDVWKYTVLGKHHTMALRNNS